MQGNISDSVQYVRSVIYFGKIIFIRRKLILRPVRYAKYATVSLEHAYRTLTISLTLNMVQYTFDI